MVEAYIFQAGRMVLNLRMASNTEDLARRENMGDRATTNVYSTEVIDGNFTTLHDEHIS